jgi:hypothetical protein
MHHLEEIKRRNRQPKPQPEGVHPAYPAWLFDTDMDRREHRRWLVWSYTSAPAHERPTLEYEHG